MQLFALIANVSRKGVSGRARQIVESYLVRRINREIALEYVAIFDSLIAERMHATAEQSFDAEEVRRHCTEVNSILHQKEKVIVFVRLVEFVFEDGIISPEEERFIRLVAEHFNIRESEFIDIVSFITADVQTDFQSDTFLLIDNESEAEKLGGEWFVKNVPQAVMPNKHIFVENFPGKIVVVHVHSVHTFFYRYFGAAELFFNNRVVLPNQTFVLDHGGILKGTKIRPVYYADVAVHYSGRLNSKPVTLTVDNAAFHFKGSKHGIEPFSLREESGNMVGIMGGSGTGKSTFLNLLNGKLPLRQGEIRVNGYDIHEYKFEGIIGYVPQDDLLMEELTVFQNLYYNAKLSFSQYSERQILQKVVKVLKDFSLYEIKDLQVGNPLNKKISGGQRKRLNIALEMLREPTLLFVDEPTSGLSSADSESMMLLLKEQTLKNKLVFANIHQPSSDIFKLLDKLIVLDKGGRVIYYGNPLDALVYFKSEAEFVNATESECASCGNVNPEQILNIVELKEVNEFGRFTENRRVSPSRWHSIFKSHHTEDLRLDEVDNFVPHQVYRAPSYAKQFRIFLKRNVLSKLANLQYLLITFLEAPLLALILGRFTKYIAGTNDDPHAYLFIENTNLPSYLFMAVVVALFLGLTVSAEEIIRDRRILERESFLNLSRFSYINAKIVVLFFISAVQMATFVLVGNATLEINSLWFEYWIILFSTAAIANMLGLNISSTLNSVVTIYITIPFILVPQLLLSGTIVSFDKLNESFANKEVTPIWGDLMPSRWAYEALAVTQFSKNDYMREIFRYEMELKNIDYYQSLLIERLESKLDMADLQLKMKRNDAELTNTLAVLRNEMKGLATVNSLPQFEYLGRMTKTTFSDWAKGEAKDYLEYAKISLRAKHDSVRHEKELVLTDLNERLKSKGLGLLKLKQNNHNKQLEVYLTNRYERQLTLEFKNRIIRKQDPIYKLPESTSGRAHFYAPAKRVGTKYIDTMWFNVAILWVLSGILYLTLYFDSFRILFYYATRISKKVQGMLNMK